MHQVHADVQQVIAATVDDIHAVVNVDEMGALNGGRLFGKCHSSLPERLGDRLELNHLKFHVGCVSAQRNPSFYSRLVISNASYEMTKFDLIEFAFLRVLRDFVVDFSKAKTKNVPRPGSRGPGR